MIRALLWIFVGFMLGVTTSAVTQPIGLPVVTVSGPVTVGNCVQWLTTTVVQDAGKTC